MATFTNHEKTMQAVMTEDVSTAAQAFVDELVSSTEAAIRRDPRAFGFVTLKEHDARVTELLEANNREVEARRAAEARVPVWEHDLLATIRSLPFGCGNEQAAAAVAKQTSCSECGHKIGSVLGCTSQTCPIKHLIGGVTS